MGLRVEVVLRCLWQICVTQLQCKNVGQPAASLQLSWPAQQRLGVLQHAPLPPPTTYVLNQVNHLQFLGPYGPCHFPMHDCNRVLILLAKQ
jgi:hypothetical protein